MASFIKVPDFNKNLADGIIDLDDDSIRIALSNTAPASESSNPTSDGNGVLANITQIAYTNYGDDLTVDRVLEGITTAISSGVTTLDAANFIITPSGGPLATWRYLWIYSDTPTSPADPLICGYDQGSAISLADGQPANINFNPSGILTIT